MRAVGTKEEGELWKEMTSHKKSGRTRSGQQWQKICALDMDARSGISQ